MFRLRSRKIQFFLRRVSGIAVVNVVGFGRPSEERSPPVWTKYVFCYLDRVSGRKSGKWIEHRSGQKGST
ncbi:hypothetical protein SLA2020_331420 [Shorea laevis]